MMMLEKDPQFGMEIRKSGFGGGVSKCAAGADEQDLGPVWFGEAAFQIRRFHDVAQLAIRLAIRIRSRNMRIIFLDQNTPAAAL
jgi:hypothetical protein